MLNIGRLIADHDALDLVADHLIASARPGRDSAAACRAILDEFIALLDAHLAAEACFVYEGPAGPAPGLALDQRAFERDFSALTAVWQVYLDRWDEAAIAADRAGFWYETTDMMTAVKLRIAAENAVLYALALNVGRIAKRA